MSAMWFCVLMVLYFLAEYYVPRVASMVCDDDVINCPCGAGGTNTVVTIKRCYSTNRGCVPCDGRSYTTQMICDQFKFCRTCHNSRDGGCISCPQGVYGKSCLHEQTCGKPPNLQNGFYEGSDWVENKRVRYYCKHQWILTGDSELICQNGRWTGTRPSCALSCGPPPYLNNGQFGASNWIEGAHALYQCTGNTFMQGDSRLVCRDAKWRGQIPTCLAGCGQPPDITNGRYNGSNWTNGGRVRYHCNPRRSLTGSSELFCDGSRWRGVVPSCVLGCGQPPNLHNGRFEGNNWNDGDRVQYYCNKRWVLSGDSQLVCRDGQWSGIKPSCGITCPSPEGKHRVVNPVMGTYTFNTIVSITCEAGFTSEKSGPFRLTCTSTGEWNSPYPRCTKRTVPAQKICSPPSSPNNGRVVPSSQAFFSPKERVEFICDTGYILTGSPSSVCGSDGTWSGNSPRCIKVLTCVDPGIPPNGKRSTINLQFGGSRSAGNRIAGSRQRLSQRALPKSARSSAKLVVPHGQFQVHTTLTFSCDSTLYELVGSSQRKCQASGKWSGDQPSCQPVCGKLNRLKSATIINGKVARRGDWPWQAFVAIRQTNGMFFGVCAGSIVNERWIVTAAHCVSTKLAADVRVYLGKYFRDDRRDDNSVRKFEISDIRIHPNYNPLLLDFDIALLKLSTKATFTAQISPICLPSIDSTGERLADNLVRPGSVLTVAGWGQTENGTPSDVLRVAQVRTISNAECQNKYFRSGFPIPVTRNMFCAGQPDGKTDTCYGDSGAPTMAISGTDQNRKWYLVGVVSWGSPIDCAVVNQYGGYTRIARFLKFIGDIL